MLHFSLLLLAGTGYAQSSDGFRSVAEAEGLAVGTPVPDFDAQQLEGGYFELSEALKEGPVVLLFYRGQWCPVCSRYLSGLQDSLELITQTGARVVAVSPEKPENLEKTAKKTGASFTLLYDEGFNISKIFDVLFTPEKTETKKYNTFLNAKLKKAHSDDSQRLPVPATFIVSQNQKVIWRHFNPDYKKRASVKSIVEHLP